MSMLKGLSVLRAKSAFRRRSALCAVGPHLYCGPVEGAANIVRNWLSPAPMINEIIEGGHGLLRYGFVGVGHLGGKLSGSLLREGFSLTVTDLSKDRAAPLLARGVR